MLVPTLQLMIDLSERMDDNEKKSWHNILPIVSEKIKFELLDKLWNESIGKIVYGKEFYITQVRVQNKNGDIPQPVSGSYPIKVEETFMITVDFTNPSNHNLIIPKLDYLPHFVLDRRNQANENAPASVPAMSHLAGFGV